MAHELATQLPPEPEPELEPEEEPVHDPLLHICIDCVQSVHEPPPVPHAVSIPAV